MPLSAGKRLGPYEVVSAIGAGGMGEVYQARDTRLKRDVALKVLPAVFSSDPDHLARFQREAELLASLDHPNIGPIYGIEQSQGEWALVLALIEGPTLADLIERGPLPLDEAIAYAKQIVEAMEYAHERGVIHRDLKPANIKVTPDGVVKVLDFGLAKALDQRTSGTTLDPNNSPTLSMGATQVGVIMGTAAYMSPEQAVGKTADRRADIFSFGAVLFEMLTGRRAFLGETTGETLAAVVKDAPDWPALPGATPAHLRRLLERTLHKDRTQRLQAIGEARIALAAPQMEEAPRLAETPAQPKRPWAMTAAAVVFALVAGVVAFVHFRESPPEVRAVITTLLPPGNAEFDFDAPYAMPAISPDGTRVVYGAKGMDGKRQLWVRRLDSPTEQALPGTEDAATPFWSADSRWVGFGQAMTLKKVDIQGGPPVTVADLPGFLRGGSWNAQDVILVGVQFGARSILRVAASGGAAVRATAEDKTSSVQRHPWFLPDGRHFLYVITSDQSVDLKVGSLDEPDQPGKPLGSVDSPAAYAQGHLLYLRENTLMAQAFDERRLETTREAIPIAEGISTFTTGSRIPGFTVSPSGLLLYQTGGAGSRKPRLLLKDREGKVLRNLAELHVVDGGLTLSPDGKRAAIADYDGAGGNQDVWVYDVARGIRTRLTFDPGRDTDPVWSPDGADLYFSSNRKGVFNLYRKSSNGAGTEELIFEDAANKYAQTVSPDGKLLLYLKVERNRASGLWVIPLTHGQGGAKAEPHAFVETPFLNRLGQFSPDGRWVLYQSNESGQVQVYVAPFPGPGGKRQISEGGGFFARWRKDGKEVYYAGPRRALMATEVAVRNGTLEVGKTQSLFGGIITSLRSIGAGASYDVSTDGQQFLVVDDGASEDMRPLTLVQNWTLTLRK